MFWPLGINDLILLLAIVLTLGVLIGFVSAVILLYNRVKIRSNEIPCPHGYTDWESCWICGKAPPPQTPMP